jgi:hypothetical protein
MYRRIVEASKLELGVKRRPLTSVGAERVTVGCLEIRPDRSTARPIVNAHEAGRLAIANRRRERREVEEFGQPRLIRRFQAEMADVAPPGQKLGEGRLERRVEQGRLTEGIGQFRFSPPLSPTSGPARLAYAQAAESTKRISRSLRFARSVKRRAGEPGEVIVWVVFLIARCVRDWKGQVVRTASRATNGFKGSPNP